MVTYLYGMRLRGYSPGCQPNDGLIEARETVKDDYYNVLVYTRQLTYAEEYWYSLDYLGADTSDEKIGQKEDISDVGECVVITAEQYARLLKRDLELEKMDELGFLKDWEWNGAHEMDETSKALIFEEEDSLRVVKALGKRYKIIGENK